MPSFQSALIRHSQFLAGFPQAHPGDFAALDGEYPALQRTLANIQKYPQNEFLAEMLLTILRNWELYLVNRSKYRLILTHAGACLAVTREKGLDPTWIYLLAFEANFGLGNWDAASDNVKAALELRSVNLPSQASALFAQGRLQMNRGDYLLALRSLERAIAIFQELGDARAAIAARAELFSYYLNKGEYPKALAGYQEIEQEELAIEHMASDHTLLMLGVCYRRLGDAPQALKYLGQLHERTRQSQNGAGEATASHHLAWVYLNLGEVDIAETYSQQAKTIYEEVADPRGLSDACEQLAIIALHRKDDQTAERLLKETLVIRQRLRNRQGAASTLRRFSKLYFQKGDYLRGAIYLFRAAAGYQKIGMLSRKRIARWLRPKDNSPY